jgi:hypothetical protein
MIEWWCVVGSSGVAFCRCGAEAVLERALPSQR